MSQSQPGFQSILVDLWHILESQNCIVKNHSIPNSYVEPRDDSDAELLEKQSPNRNCSLKCIPSHQQHTADIVLSNRYPLNSHVATSHSETSEVLLTGLEYVNRASTGDLQSCDNIAVNTEEVAKLTSLPGVLKVPTPMVHFEEIRHEHEAKIAGASTSHDSNVYLHFVEGFLNESNIFQGGIQSTPHNEHILQDSSWLRRGSMNVDVEVCVNNSDGSLKRCWGAGTQDLLEDVDEIDGKRCKLSCSSSPKDVVDFPVTPVLRRTRSKAAMEIQASLHQRMSGAFMAMGQN